MKTMILNTGLINQICVGMYCSYLDPNDIIDWDAIPEELQDDFNFDAYKKFIAEVFNEVIDVYGTMNSEGVSITLSSIDNVIIESPREYNFYTDTIDFKVTYDPKQIKALVKREYDRFDDYLKAHYSSRDGFLSFTPDNAVEWLIKFNTDNPQAIASFLNYWNHYHGGFFEEIQENFVEDVQESAHEYEFDFFLEDVA